MCICMKVYIHLHIMYVHMLQILKDTVVLIVSKWPR
jgi:hypothetical protein